LKPISIKQAAEKIGVSYGQLHYAINTKKVKARTLGRELYFLPEDLPALKKHFREEKGGE
jgi:hypothetical protein